MKVYKSYSFILPLSNTTPKEQSVYSEQVALQAPCETISLSMFGLALLSVDLPTSENKMKYVWREETRTNQTATLHDLEFEKYNWMFAKPQPKNIPKRLGIGLIHQTKTSILGPVWPRLSARKRRGLASEEYDTTVKL